RASGENVASYVITPAAAGATLSNYDVAYAPGSFAISKAAATVTANNRSKTFGQTVTFTGTEFTTSGLTEGDAVATVTLASAGAPASAGAGTYDIVAGNAVGTGLGNYDISYVKGTLTVNKADQVIDWSNPAAINYGTALSSTQLNATQTTGDGALTYSPAAGTMLNAGTQTLTVNAAATANYNVASKSVTIEVAKATQTISFPTIGKKTYGQADFQITATASSGLTVSFSASGNCTIHDGNWVHLTGAGSCTIVASQSGNGSYSAALNVSQTFDIDKKKGSVKVTAANKIYDGTQAAT